MNRRAAQNVEKRKSERNVHSLTHTYKHKLLDGNFVFLNAEMKTTVSLVLNRRKLLFYIFCATNGDTPTNAKPEVKTTTIIPQE